MKLFFDYLKIIAYALMANFLLRIFETTATVTNFGFQQSLLSSELLGWFMDSLTTNALLLATLPLYYILYKLSSRLANTLFLSAISFLLFFHFLILQYFVHQLQPLDIFLYSHSFQEIKLTIQTANVSFFSVSLFLSILFIVLLLLFYYLNKQHYSKRLSLIGCSISIFLFTIYGIVEVYDGIEYDLFSISKPRYFYVQSFSYFMQDDKIEYTVQDGLAYQKLHPSYSYLNDDYPLLHTFEKEDVLGPYFNAFESAPNIVVLIVEGLNDDFIHPYRGVYLMPYLSKLKNESLYWDHCFSVGERSFAVVPSLTGSLPYGEGGFMQSPIIPTHLSLVSILGANNYHTGFFYGQAKWFHNKAEYFERNRINLIVDNTSFQKKYEKIIVGSENFFWGYNDKDLFQQSLHIIDSLPAKKRLDIYFTGTSHSPYIIADTAYYENKFSELVKKLQTKEDASFFKIYKKYLLTELFVNDALEDVMNAYRQRKDFNNTIFIITGDHPMTELPRKNELKKYHVPLLIYSPGLKKAQRFSQPVSHLDLYESLLSFLSAYGIKVPPVSTAIGDPLNTTDHSENKKIVFMNGNRQTIDYLSDNYFLSGNQLYKVRDDLSITKSTDKFRERQLKKELNAFNKLNLFVCQNNKIIPDSLYCSSLLYQLVNSQKRDSVTLFLESEELVKEVLMNKDFFVDLSFTCQAQPQEGLSVIHEVKNKKGDLLVWQRNGINKETGKFKLNTKIPIQQTNDDTLYFKAILINSKKERVKLTDFNVLIYYK